jgi:DNA-binding winged helix-turn-helix (wHTH) protein
MAAQINSKKNQTARETAFRFGEFQLYPAERLLKRNDAPVPLTAKALDTLHCLVSNAGRLVSKEALMETVWPGTFVAEANLTNAIVSLRKIVGRDAIRTVSKYGYRFELSVDGEPGVTRSSYEVFARAKELTSHRSMEGLMRARDLYWLCLAEDPEFAPAWAWLGRTCAILAKFSDKSGDTEMTLAHAALRRAFTIDPDLACAHQFYTTIQTDTGEAIQALERLRLRLSRHPAEPETLAGLVQALRFCGLLEESVEAHRSAKELDPAIVTSVAHTHFLRGEFQATLESYGGRAAFYLDAAAWAALGQRDRARTLLAQRLPTAGCSAMMTAAMSSLLAIVEERFSDAVAIMESRVAFEEPELLFYFARHYGYLDRADEALRMMRRVVDQGFVCSPQTLRDDPWLDSVRARPGFSELLRTAEDAVEITRRKWRSWGKQPLFPAFPGTAADSSYCPG